MRLLLLALLVPITAVAAPPKCRPLAPEQAKSLAALPPPTAFCTYASGAIELQYYGRPRVKGVRVCDIGAFFSAVRVFERRVVLQKTPGHILERGWGRLLLDGRVVYDLASTIAQLWKIQYPYEKDEPEVVDVDLMERAGPLSFVGPLLTPDVEDEGSEGGPDGNGGDWNTLDARTGKAADLLDWVNEDAIVAALKKDPYVRRKVNARVLARINHLSDLDMLTKEADEPLLGKLRETFAFYDYDPVRNLVAVRFPVIKDMLFDKFEILTIRVWVPPKPALQEALVAATKGDGLLARHAKNVAFPK